MKNIHIQATDGGREGGFRTVESIRQDQCLKQGRPSYCNEHDRCEECARGVWNDVKDVCGESL